MLRVSFRSIFIWKHSAAFFHGLIFAKSPSSFKSFILQRSVFFDWWLTKYAGQQTTSTATHCYLWKPFHTSPLQYNYIYHNPVEYVDMGECPTIRRRKIFKILQGWVVLYRRQFGKRWVIMCERKEIEAVFVCPFEAYMRDVECKLVCVGLNAGDCITYLPPPPVFPTDSNSLTVAVWRTAVSRLWRTDQLHFAPMASTHVYAPARKLPQSRRGDHLYTRAIYIDTKIRSDWPALMYLECYIYICGIYLCLDFPMPLPLCLPEF